MTRGFGLVALILLTITMVLGLTQAVRYARPGLPRFVISALHKNASLLAVAVIAVHIATAVMDTYAPIRIVDVFVPFISKYRPVWTGLGALAVDILVAVTITSLLRERLGHRAWRAVHWAAYACWPVALVHGLGTGSDSKLGWVEVLNVVCTVAILGALWWRLARGWSLHNALGRGMALGGSFLLSVAVVAWAATGPLKAGWAHRAGTPASLLGSSSASVSNPVSSPGTAGPTAPVLHVPFSATFAGTQAETGPTSDGLVSVTIRGNFNGSQTGTLSVVLTGQPSNSGGVSLTGSQVDLGPASQPKLYEGHITQLQGSSLVASLSDAAGSTLVATIRLNLSQGSSQVSGSLQVQS
jgi:hypothetical protein